jgi:site-specific recombinase XerD
VLAGAAANDIDDRRSPALSPAETYLLGLAPGSRRAMAHALAVIADIVAPGSSAATLDWAAVTYAETARVRAALAPKYSPNMANKCLAALRGTLKAAFRLGLIDADHLARATDIRRIRGTRATKGRSLDAKEIGCLLGACDTSTARGVRNDALIAVGCGCGLRRAELVGLNMQDVLDGGQALRVRGKGDKERGAYLPAFAQAHLAKWMGHRGDSPGPLFCRMAGDIVIPRKLSEQTVYDVLMAAARRAGIARVSPHDLRRTFVSTLLDHGVALSTASALAGHADVSTTARYDRRGERAKRDAVRHLELVFSIGPNLLAPGSDLEARS